MLTDYVPHIPEEDLRFTHAEKLILSTYVLVMEQSRLWADTSNIPLAMLIDYVLLPIRRVRYVQHHVCMLLLVQSRQRYTLLDVCTVPVRIHAINVHGCLLTVDLQAVPPPNDEHGAMRAIMNFLAHAHG